MPGVLFQVGESFLTEKKFDEAIAAWGPLTTQVPRQRAGGPRPVPDGLDLRDREGRSRRRPSSGSRRSPSSPGGRRRQQRIAVMEARALTVLTPRAFRSGEAASLKITTRNLEKLTFTAYKLNPEAYFRKKHGLENVESLDIGLVAPDAEWTVDVPGYARYKPVETTYELKKLELPGRLRGQGDRREAPPGDDPGRSPATSTRSSRPRATRSSSSPRT